MKKVYLVTALIGDNETWEENLKIFIKRKDAEKYKMKYTKVHNRMSSYIKDLDDVMVNYEDENDCIVNPSSPDYIQNALTMWGKYHVKLEHLVRCDVIEMEVN